MGRLAMRVAYGRDDLKVVHVNEPNGDATAAAHLLTFDSVHGRWGVEAEAVDGRIRIGESVVGYSQATVPQEVDWAGADVDLVLECSGEFRRWSNLQPYLEQVERVVVAAPVKDDEVPNFVVGVNDDLFDGNRHRVVTAASCTTNCIAPVVKVMLETFGIRHGVVTTIHAATNTQVVVDGMHRDLRRARAAGSSLIPTTTGSATAITMIFPELEGKLDGIAVRMPLLQASLADCVFELERAVSVEEVNAAMREAASGRLAGILGYEDRPLVSSDYVNDTRSGIVDGQSTMVVDGTQVKLLVWYDNEYGYVNRMVELAARVGSA
jgi:glyceraldehyde 3-phosphate dehydrogenase